MPVAFADRTIRAANWVFLCSLIALVTWHFGSVMRMKGWKDALIIISNRASQEDLGLLELSGKDARRLTYARADSAYGAAVLKSAKLATPKPGSLALLHLDSSGPSLLDQDEAARTLERVDQEVRFREWPFFLVLPILGLAAGVYAGHVVWRLRSTLLFAAMLASLYKFVHACPVCPKFEFLGLDFALWGVFAYAALAALTLTTWVGGLLNNSISIGISVMGVTQIVLLTTNSYQCLPCEIILSINVALSATILRRRDIAAQVSNTFGLRKSLALGVVAIILSATVLATRPRGELQAATAPLARKQPSFHTHQFTNISAVLAERKVQLPCLVIVVHEGCEACAAAERDMRTRKTPVVFLNSILPGDSAASPGGLPFSTFPVSSTPWIMGVNRSGVVVFEKTGWASDPGWISQLERQFNTTCLDKS